MENLINSDTLEVILLAEKRYTENYINNRLSNISIKQITQAEYDALTTKDANTLYLITE